MVDPGEWRWIEEHATGDFDHLLIGTSLPLLLAPGMHYLEAWNEAVCDGAWGEPAAALGEKLRQGLDLEHWAAFGRRFERSRGARGGQVGSAAGAPASIVTLSGDVHHAYLAEVGVPGRERGALGRLPGDVLAVPQPARRPGAALDPGRVDERVARSARVLARTAGVGPPPIRWRFAHDEPWFDNQVCFIELDGRRSRLWLQKTAPGEDDGFSLETVFEQRLA